MKLKLILSAALVAGVISASAATQPAVTPAATNASPAQSMKDLFGDPVVAKGKGFEIKQSEFDQVMSGVKANATAQGQALPPEAPVAILNQLITIHALLQKATDADRAKGRAEAEQLYSNAVKRYGSAEGFERQLKAIGVTPDEFRAKAAQEITAKTALIRELKINVTDADVKAFYDKHSADFEQPEMAHVRRILLLTIDPYNRSQLPTNSVAAKRKQIDDLLKQVRAGGDFVALAKQYSEDPNTKDNGGEMPEFPRGQMGPGFEASAFSLSNNQVSDVVVSPYGFEIIKMINKTPAKTYGLNDILPAPNKTVAEICKIEVEGEKVKELSPDYVKNLRKELSVEIVDPSLKSLDDSMRARAAAETQAAEQATPAK
jgi:parvulin-like peptidyl-prolyl isomerase